MEEETIFNSISWYKPDFFSGLSEIPNPFKIHNEFEIFKEISETDEQFIFRICFLQHHFTSFEQKIKENSEILNQYIQWSLLLRNKYFLMCDYDSDVNDEINFLTFGKKKEKKNVKKMEKNDKESKSSKKKESDLIQHFPEEIKEIKLNDSEKDSKSKPIKKEKKSSKKKESDLIESNLMESNLMESSIEEINEMKVEKDLKSKQIKKESKSSKKKESN